MESYPLITVHDLPASRDFFAGVFGMTIVFEAAWVVMLADPGSERISLGLMSADHPSSPPGPETFVGRGVLFTVQVEDADAEYERMRAAGVAFSLDLVDAPWGQRRFMVTDPSGIQVDVVEQIEPAEGFWDPYLG